MMTFHSCCFFDVREFFAFHVSQVHMLENHDKDQKVLKLWIVSADGVRRKVYESTEGFAQGEPDDPFDADNPNVPFIKEQPI